MKQADFTQILQKPQVLTNQQTDELKLVIAEFPYFQSARALYLKGLKDQSSIQYNQELKITASYTTDRSILFDFITSEVFSQNEISETIKNNHTNLTEIYVEAEDLSVDKNVTIDDTLKQQINDTDGVLDPALFEPKVIEAPNETSKVREKTETQEATAEVILELGKPLQFKDHESHSFNEWLQLTRLNPIKRPATEQKPAANIETVETNSVIDLEKEEKFKLIDKFIAKNPKISPTKPLSQKGNLAKAQMIQPEALMTETLARIYVEQKNYRKAIQSYKILSLKYPEKSGFFANQIKAVEQLQEQNNKK